MANPYHDETGKFCSRGEMIAAIDRAALSGKPEVYLALRKEFEEIESDKITIPREAISDAKLMKEKLIELAETEEDLRQAISLKDSHTVGNEAVLRTAVFTHKAASPEFRKEFLASLPKKESQYIINTMNWNTANVDKKYYDELYEKWDEQ